MPTIAEIIDIAKICQYLSFIDYKNRGLYGAGVDPKLPRKLYCIRSNVEWLYNLDPTNDTLIGTANYLYALCVPYSGQAQIILDSGGAGGIIINPSTGQPSNLRAINLPFEIGVTSSPVVINGVNVTLPNPGDNTLTIPLPDIINGSIQVVKDGIVMTTSSTLSQYYSIVYSPTQVVITLQPLGNTFENNQNWLITGWQTVAA